MKNVARIFIVASVLLPSFVLAQDSTESLKDAENSLAHWWIELEKAEPYASRALLMMSRTPDETVQFLSQKLKPLQLSRDELKQQLENLGSQDETVWHSAFAELEYFDPRLALDLETILDEVDQAPTRQRLVEVLSGRQRGSLAGQNISLSNVGQDGFNFRSEMGSWWAEHRIKRLNGLYGNQKSKWTRANRAISLLEHIGTPDALSILLELGAGGHEEAQPTKAAREAGLRLMRKMKKESD